METLSKPRSNLQSARFHALCGEVAKQARFGGRSLSAQQWKVLFVSGLMMIEGIDPDLTEGIEGELVMLRESTARMSSARMNDLIEYATAYCALVGVDLQK